MTLRPHTSIYICADRRPGRRFCCTCGLRLAVALLALACCMAGWGQKKWFRMEKDSIPLFRGVTVMADLVGPAELVFSDYGQVEGALRVNLHDQWFPVLELGFGHARHIDDVVTGFNYTTDAPYFRLGCDFNILRKKHAPHLLYIGLRYAFTSYSMSISHPTYKDPTWQWETVYDVDGERCHQHWVEALFGLDARVFGPVRLGWSVRYRRRLHRNEGVTENAWYVPGYGTSGSSKLGVSFNVGVDINVF